MWALIKRKIREKRAKQYLLKYPEDLPAVEGILMTLFLDHSASARDAAEVVGGRRLSDEEWSKFGDRWERAWSAIVKNSD